MESKTKEINGKDMALSAMSAFIKAVKSGNAEVAYDALCDCIEMHELEGAITCIAEKASKE